MIFRHGWFVPAATKLFLRHKILTSCENPEHLQYSGSIGSERVHKNGQDGHSWFLSLILCRLADLWIRPSGRTELAFRVGGLSITLLIFS